MKKVGFFIASLAASSAIVTSKPVVAATFNFSFQNSPGGAGTLSFNGTVPIGTVPISQLNNASLLYAFTGQPSAPGAIATIFGPSNNNTTLTFADGNLIGITSEATLLNFDRTFFPGGSTAGEIKGDYTLFLQGDRYSQYFTGTVSFGGFDPSTGQFFNNTTPYNNQELQSGFISFQNPPPPELVPEPSTTLGMFAALGLVVGFRRKLMPIK
ncbi:MAG: PEP-CTERM sorting domain-containing protein [Chroococcidiopsidaceae cyanobacterium CP_BM_ER_R8_30]|nr:PEP-CTERM sorting domain-containing protein [Chroococcidiopsidaceae cyanobacterium CP_BM_ER_R8_30]